MTLAHLVSLTSCVSEVDNADCVLVDSKVDSSYLKRDGDIILQPQPSDSPNDPLNW